MKGKNQKKTKKNEIDWNEKDKTRFYAFSFLLFVTMAGTLSLMYFRFYKISIVTFVLSFIFSYFVYEEIK